MTTLSKITSRVGALSLVFLSTIAYAQTDGGGKGGSGSGTVGGNIATFLNFVNDYLVPLVFAVAFLLFLWGVFRYFIAGGDSDENRKEGRMFVLYAIIGFVVMSATWGLVNLIRSSVEFGDENQPPFPTIQQTGGGGT